MVGYLGCDTDSAELNIVRTTTSLNGWFNTLLKYKADFYVCIPPKYKIYGNLDEVVAKLDEHNEFSLAYTDFIINDPEVSVPVHQYLPPVNKLFAVNLPLILKAPILQVKPFSDEEAIYPTLMKLAQRVPVLHIALPYFSYNV